MVAAVRPGGVASADRTGPPLCGGRHRDAHAPVPDVRTAEETYKDATTACPPLARAHERPAIAVLA